MHIHVNHSSYFKYLSSFVGVSIAIVETSNIIDHQLHLHFPLVEIVLVGLLITFVIGLFITYRNQKKPDRIQQRILTKFENWKDTNHSKFKLNTPELLNVKLFPDLAAMPRFLEFLDYSRQTPAAENVFSRALPILNVFLLVGFLGLGGMFYLKLRKASTTIEKDLPEFLQLIKEGKPGLAYYKGKKILESDPKNTLVLDGLSRITTTVDLYTVTPNVDVELLLDPATQEWEKLGTTPLKKISLPNGLVHLRFTDAQKQAFEIPLSTYFISTGENTFELPPAFPDTTTMSLVIGSKSTIFLAGLDSRPPASFGPFLIDKTEVSNAEYKKFVDAGGYKNPAYWSLPQQFNGQPFNLEQAQKLFIDKTGFPGPSSWTNGSFPEGKGNFPVGGLSWYEADAFAHFMKKQLPSAYHWAKAASPALSGTIVPASNFSKTDLKEIPFSKIRSGFGLYDVAGNVREWCANPTKEDHSEHAILGGGFDDEPYTFNDYYGQNSFDRSETNGIRLMRALNDNHPEVFREVIQKPYRDFLKLPRISPEVFAVYKRQFDYEQRPLEAKTLKTDDSDPDLTYEWIEYNAAYNQERMSGILFKPKNVTGKLPAIIYFPGSNLIHTREIEKVTLGQIPRSFIKMGHALFFPIYKGTVNRADGLKSDYSDVSDFYKEHVIMWGKDMKRSIDLMATRPELDLSNLIYFGVSWGGEMGNIMIPIEDRIRRAVLLVAGLNFEEAQPEVEAYQYTPYIKIPVLMLNGKYDFFFPVETSQKPMFQLIGTNAKDKYWHLHESSHTVPIEDFTKEVKNFLSKYATPQ